MRAWRTRITPKQISEPEAKHIKWCISSPLTFRNIPRGRNSYDNKWFRLRAGSPGNSLSIPGRGRRWFCSPERPNCRVLITWVKQAGGDADLVPGLGMKSLSKFQFIYPKFCLDYPGIWAAPPPWEAGGYPPEPRHCPQSLWNGLSWIRIRFGVCGVEFMGSINWDFNLLVC